MQGQGPYTYDTPGDHVSAAFLQHLIKTQEGDYPRPRFTRGGSMFSRNQMADRGIKRYQNDNSNYGLARISDFFMARGGKTDPNDPNIPAKKKTDKEVNFKDIGIMDSTQYGNLRPIKVDRFLESGKQNSNRAVWEGDYVAPGITSYHNYIKPITGNEKSLSGRPRTDPEFEKTTQATGKGYEQMLQLLAEHPALERFKIDPKVQKGSDFLGMDVKEYPSFDPTESDRKFYDVGDNVYRLRRPAVDPASVMVAPAKPSNLSPSDSNLRRKPEGFDYRRNRPAPGSITMRELGGLLELAKGGKNWIQGAVNPAHKGYCTPMTKSTCTGRRKAFAKTMKKHHGFH